MLSSASICFTGENLLNLLLRVVIFFLFRGKDARFGLIFCYILHIYEFLAPLLHFDCLNNIKAFVSC